MPATGEALALLYKLQSTRTRDALEDVLQHVTDRYGFSAFAICHFSEKDGQAKVDILLDGMPVGLGQRFVDQCFGGPSLMSQRAWESDKPFFWHDAPYDRAAEPDMHKLMSEAAASGLVDGFCIPVRLPRGGRGLVSFSGAAADLSDDEQLAFQAIGLAAHAQMLHLAVPVAAQRGRLTPREREVLHWTAGGKTADATSEILGISVRTVEYHLLNASRKLNTANRTHTVVEALRSGQLSL